MNLIKKPIVIVGSGFAGINAAINLKKINPHIPIVVIDSNPRFIFKPLLYEVLSNEMKSWEVTPLFKDIYTNSGITFIQNHVKSISFKENLLKFRDDRELQYQYLVLCTGSTHNDFSLKGVDQYCYLFNNDNHQTKLKGFLEQPLVDSLIKDIFIIGGGPSGVELACKISDIFQEKFKISIIERESEILNKNKIFNREEAEKAIKRKNISLLVGTQVQEITEDKIIVLNNSNQLNHLNYHAVIWTAGIKPNLPSLEQDVKKVNGRILINKNLQLIDNENVFAIGDIATLEDDDNLPITAQVAMQQGKHVAANINLLINKKNLLPFNFIDNGEMMSLGIGEASISGLGLTFSGKLAFDIRRLIYASKMPILKGSLKSTASWLLDKKSIIAKVLSKY